MTFQINWDWPRSDISQLLQYSWVHPIRSHELVHWTTSNWFKCCLTWYQPRAKPSLVRTFPLISGAWDSWKQVSPVKPKAKAAFTTFSSSVSLSLGPLPCSEAIFFPHLPSAADILTLVCLVAFHALRQIQLQVGFGFPNHVPVCLDTVSIFPVGHLACFHLLYASFLCSRMLPQHIFISPCFDPQVIPLVSVRKWNYICIYILSNDSRLLPLLQALSFANSKSEFQEDIRMKGNIRLSIFDPKSEVEQYTQSHHPNSWGTMCITWQNRKYFRTPKNALKLPT